jgi:hypothetical protein
MGGRPKARYASASMALPEEDEESDEDMGFGLFDGEGAYAASSFRPAKVLETAVTSQNHISATFGVPGKILHHQSQRITLSLSFR